MIDFDYINGELVISDTTVHKAANVMQTQQGSLHYAQDFGLDLKRFFDPDVEIQTETFKAYSIQRLTDCGVNVLDLVSKTDILQTSLDYYVQLQGDTGLVAR